jgi:hypothetical protein
MPHSCMRLASECSVIWEESTITNSRSSYGRFRHSGRVSPIGVSKLHATGVRGELADPV